MNTFCLDQPWSRNAIFDRGDVVWAQPLSRWKVRDRRIGIVLGETDETPEMIVERGKNKYVVLLGSHRYICWDRQLEMANEADTYAMQDRKEAHGRERVDKRIA